MIHVKNTGFGDARVRRIYVCTSIMSDPLVLLCLRVEGSSLIPTLSHSDYYQQHIR